MQEKLDGLYKECLTELAFVGVPIEQMGEKAEILD